MADRPRNSDTTRQNAPATEYERTAREADAAMAERKAAEKIAKSHRLPEQGAPPVKPTVPRTTSEPKPTAEDEP